MRKNTIRIIAIALAAIMLIGVLAGAIINTFALENVLTFPSSTVDKSKILPIVIAAAAVIVAAVCIIVPVIKKKSSKNSSDKDA